MAALPPQPVDINGKPFTRGTSEEELDQWNRAMRSSDLYQDFLKHIGKVDTGAGVQLSTSEQAQLEAKLASSGIQVPKTDFQIDQGGNLNQGNRLKRNLAIAAAIGVGGYFAAPYIAGALGAGGAGAGGAGAAGTVTSTGLGTGALSGLGVGSTVGGVAGAGAGAAGAAGAAGTLGTLGTIGSVLSKAGPLLGAAGKAVGAATSAAGNNRLTQENAGLTANSQNIAGQNANVNGQSAFENELMNRAKEETTQRQQALKDEYRASFAKNRTAGPYNAKGLTPYSPEYMSSLSALEQQGVGKLATGATYDTNKMPELKPTAPYTPINPANVQGATGTKKGTLETIGDWLGPGLSIYDLATRGGR